MLYRGFKSGTATSLLALIPKPFVFTEASAHICREEQSRQQIASLEHQLSNAIEAAADAMKQLVTLQSAAAEKGTLRKYVLTTFEFRRHSISLLLRIYT